MTPGESAISGMKLRPSSGSVTTFCCSTTKLTVPRLDWSSGAAAVTFTDSVTLPIVMREIERDLVADPQDDAVATQRGKAVLRDGDRVGARLQGEEVISAIVTRRRGLFDLRIDVEQPDLRPRNGRPDGSRDKSRKFDFRGLCVECARQQ